MPFGWPVAASVCANTQLPRLIAARSFPVGRKILQHVGRYGALGQAGNRRSKKHGSSREKCMHGIPFVDGAGRGLSHIIGIDDG